MLYVNELREGLYIYLERVMIISQSIGKVEEQNGSIYHLPLLTSALSGPSENYPQA